MADWNVLIKDDTPYTMCLIFIAFLLYSYHPKPFRIISAYYIFFSHWFLLGLEISSVQVWISYPIGVVLGMAIAEVVKEEVHMPYFWPHIGVVFFGVLPLGPTWIIFPIMFAAMTTISGYKRMSVYCIPTLIVISVVSTQIGAAPLVALCVSACMLLPFGITCPLFPKDVPFDVV
tara:strand:- start:353 stop:877 length:525 start_codon:yes stop_codon:yes gene_type:complete